MSVSIMRLALTPRFLGAMTLGALICLAPGCESAASQCRSSAECGPGERCVQGGGLYVIGGACVPEGEGIEDVGHEVEVGSEPDVVVIDVVTEPPPDSGSEPDPCHGVACSGRGLCVIAGGELACLCDEGYRAEGLTCVAVAVEDLCEGIFCSGKGTCVLAAGEPACLCETGYRPEGLSCVEVSVENPCEGVTCSGHGTCVAGGQGPRCECDEYYRADELSCVEICNGSLDMDGSCDIWVLRRGTEEWRGYRADPTGSGNGPASTIRAAFDVENQDLAFVLTQNAYHRFTPSNLSWGPALPLTDIASGLTTVDRISSASSVPGNHAGGDGTQEAVTISALDGGQRFIWQVSYNIAAQTFSRIEGALYGDTHAWDDVNAPVPGQIMLEWLDISNERGWAVGDPSQYCGTNATSLGPYVAVMTATQIHYIDVGHCAKFMPAVPITTTHPFSYPGAPPASVVGAAFWHKGGLYLFRGD